MSYVLISFFIIAIFVLYFFNISLTSLPTTFKEIVEEKISQDEVLSMTNLDIDRIDKIRIEGPTGKIVEKIEDKEIISTLLNNDLRIYNGGRFKESNEEYDLYVHFYGSIHRYTFAEDYIRTRDGNYKVLDENNEIYEYLILLYDRN